MGYAPRKTMNGYSFDEATSAMQKAIRRGDERVALFFSAELDRSGFGEYVWKRLRIICSEDIGLAEPMMPAVIRALYESWRDQFKKRETRPAERMFLIHAVLLLVRARKSRIVDHAKMVAYLSDELIEVPEYALDKHTLRGKRAGRGWDHFFAEAIRLEGEPEDLPDTYEQAARALQLAGKGPMTREETPIVKGGAAGVTDPALFDDPADHDPTPRDVTRNGGGEAAARARKVKKLVEGCQHSGIDAAKAAALDDEGRDALAGLVGVHPPSDITWAKVVETLGG